MTLFSEMNLPAMLQSALERMQFSAPTPIQEKTIPLVLEGRDVLGTAQTGTGKTGAFAIPIVARLLEEKHSAALIMTPTRELATQVMAVINDLTGFRSPIKSALLIGGEPMGKQYFQLKAKPRIIVGTPGRINDHLNRGSVKLTDTNIVVLDESDRMLDMGFGIQIDAILEHLPEARQTLLFSATLPQQILKMANRYLNEPERISVGEANAVATKVEQTTVYLSSGEKYGELTRQLGEREGTVIVFVKTKFGAERLAKRLVDDKHSAEAIHGDLQQRKRDRVIREFREKRHRILVATDVAARGLDIPHIEHVINFDLPQSPEDYIHRIGRTARANAKGSALSFISPDESRKWRAIDQLLNPNTAKREPRVEGKRHANKPLVKPVSAKSNPFGKGNPHKHKSFPAKPEQQGDKPQYSGQKKAAAGNERNSFRPAGERPHKTGGERSFAKPFGERSYQPAGDRPHHGAKEHAKENGHKTRPAKPFKGGNPKARKPAGKRAGGYGGAYRAS